MRIFKYIQYFIMIFYNRFCSHCNCPMCFSFFIHKAFMNYAILCSNDFIQTTSLLFINISFSPKSYHSTQIVIIIQSRTLIIDIKYIKFQLQNDFKSIIKNKSFHKFWIQTIPIQQSKWHYCTPYLIISVLPNSTHLKECLFKLSGTLKRTRGSDLDNKSLFFKFLKLSGFSCGAYVHETESSTLVPCVWLFMFEIVECDWWIWIVKCWEYSGEKGLRELLEECFQCVESFETQYRNTSISLDKKTLHVVYPNNEKSHMCFAYFFHLKLET